MRRAAVEENAVVLARSVLSKMKLFCRWAGSENPTQITGVDDLTTDIQGLVPVCRRRCHRTLPIHLGRPERPADSRAPSRELRRITS